jgi:hypothetical protein
LEEANFAQRVYARWPINQIQILQTFLPPYPLIFSPPNNLATG